MGLKKPMKDADLIPENIRQGIDIFGVVGSLEPGKKWASGTALVNAGTRGFSYYSHTSGTNMHYVTIPPLNFIPSFVLVFADLSISYNVTIYRKISENQGIAQFYPADGDYLATTTYSFDYTISNLNYPADLPFNPNVNVNWFAVE